ncbi:hypothetical protein [Spirosoma koreense]
MKAFLCAWLLIVSSLALAQSSRTDALYKLDRTSIDVKIDELTDTDVIYVDPATPKVKKTIARRQVWKIVFSDGSTETITPLTDKTTDTDQITLIDQTTVQGNVTRRDDRKLYYTKPNDPTNTQYELLLSRLGRIHYATGKDEVFSKTGGNAVNNQPAIRAEKTIDAAPMADNSAPAASYSDPAAFSRIHLTVGPEFAYYPGLLNKDRAWLNDSTGFGMKQNIGVSLRFDYLLLRRLAVSATVGYYGWELVRKYTREGISEYSETKRLTQIPVQIGFKIYPLSSFYVMPEGGATLLFSSYKTSDAHPEPSNESTQATPITYGGSIGYEIRRNALLLDFSLRYQILGVHNLHSPDFTINENLNITSLRIGIGFGTSRK